MILPDIPIKAASFNFLRGVVILCILSAFALPSEARRISLKIPSKQKKATIVADPSTSSLITLASDSLLFATISEAIRFSGFDKTASSSKESLFVTNRSDYHITSLNLSIEYFTTDGRQLHSCNINESCNIPAGETRKLDFPSFDSQHSFYYYKSNVPKKSATPFRVSVTLSGVGIDIPQSSTSQ